MTGKTLVTKARMLAHVAHDMIGQRRKYTGEPYWVHTDAVSDTVREHGGTPEMIAAAELHDFKEDVVTALIKQGRAKDLEKLMFEYRKFPPETKHMVDELTDFYTPERFPDMNRSERHDLEAKRLAGISVNSKTIKLADLQNNTGSIVQHDPGFARVYLVEKQVALRYLKDGDHRLYNKVVKQLKELLDILATL